MHEWALAEAVILTVKEESEKRQLPFDRITKVKLKIGELQQIDFEAFNFALETILRSFGLAADMSAWEIEPDKGILKCRVCACEWPFHENCRELPEDEKESIHFIPEIAHTYLRCPACGSPDFEIAGGRGVLVDCIEGEI